MYLFEILNTISIIIVYIEWVTLAKPNTETAANMPQWTKMAPHTTGPELSHPQ